MLEVSTMPFMAWMFFATVFTAISIFTLIQSYKYHRELKHESSPVFKTLFKRQRAYFIFTANVTMLMGIAHFLLVKPIL